METLKYHVLYRRPFGRSALRRVQRLKPKRPRNQRIQALSTQVIAGSKGKALILII